MEPLGSARGDVVPPRTFVAAALLTTLLALATLLPVLATR